MRSILKSPSDRYRSKHLIGPDLGRIWATQELFSRSLSVAIQVLFKVCAIQSLNVAILFYSAQQLTIQFLNSGSKLTIQALFMNSEPFKTLLDLERGVPWPYDSKLYWLGDLLGALSIGNKIMPQAHGAHHKTAGRM